MLSAYPLPVPGELVFNTLVGFCGAREPIKDDFLFNLRQENLRVPLDYRFVGQLGQGGKFHITKFHERWYVDCYAEDMSETRKAMIDSANARLEDIRKYFIEVNDIYNKSHMKVK